MSPKFQAMFSPPVAGRFFRCLFLSGVYLRVPMACPSTMAAGFLFQDHGRSLTDRLYRAAGSGNVVWQERQ
jgi:hypothetical protein